MLGLSALRSGFVGRADPKLTFVPGTGRRERKWAGEQLEINGLTCPGMVAVAERVAECNPVTGTRVQARAGAAQPRLHMVSDVPLQYFTMVSGDHPAVHVLGLAITFMGKKVAVHIARLKAGRSQAGDQIGVNVNARARGRSAGEKGNTFAVIIKPHLRMCLGEPGFCLGYQRFDAPTAASGCRGNFTAGVRQLRRCLGKTVTARRKDRGGIGRRVRNR